MDEIKNQMRNLMDTMNKLDDNEKKETTVNKKLPNEKKTEINGVTIDMDDKNQDNDFENY